MFLCLLCCHLYRSDNQDSQWAPVSNSPQNILGELLAADLLSVSPTFKAQGRCSNEFSGSLGGGTGFLKE